MSEYSFEEAYKTNVVYIYTLDESSHKDCVKVGKASTSKPNPSQEDIFEAAKERVKDQLKTAGLKYKSLKTKFARTLLSSLKVTQDNPRETWVNIPLQDFTSNSDIDWSKSVAEIDQQLYAKYGLSEEEIAFVESMVKEMV